MTASYAKDLTPLMAVFVFVSVIELPVVHLLIPWDTVRLVVIVLSIWGLLWMIGMLASVRVFRHLLGERALRVRYGTSVDIAVSWEAVASVSARRRSVATRKTVEVEERDDGAVVSVGVLKQTRVDVILRAPTTVELPSGPREIAELRLYADDPRAFVAAAREHLTGNQPGTRKPEQTTRIQPMRPSRSAR